MSIAFDHLGSRTRFRIVLNCLLAATGVLLILARRAQADNAGFPLLGKSDLVYVGAFRVPNLSNRDDTKTISYGGAAPGFNPERNSLFLVCHDQGQLVTELSIPKLVNSRNLNDLNTAQVLQEPAQVTNRITNLAGINSQAKIGGLQWANGRLIGAYYESYDADGSAAGSHFVVDNPPNLNESRITGLYRVGAIPAGAVAGYMCPVPAEWQAALGIPT